MNGALAAQLADPAGGVQMPAKQLQRIAGNGAASDAVQSPFATVEGLLAQLEQMGDAVEPIYADAMFEAGEQAMTEGTDVVQEVLWSPEVPAMELGWPQAMHARANQIMGGGAAADVPNKRSADSELGLLHVQAQPVKTSRSDAAIPVPVTLQVMDGGDSLVQSMFRVPEGITQQSASVHMSGVGANELGPVSNQAVPVQQGPQALVQALAQRLQLQQVQGNQVAVVRLDPPQMGVIELRISHDATGVQVHMQASNSEVGRQLVTVTDSLRQELLARSADAQITVSTSRAFSGGGQSDAQRQAWVADEDPEIGQALQGVEHAHTAHT